MLTTEGKLINVGTQTEADLMPQRIIATIKVNTPKPAPKIVTQTPIIISSEGLQFINLSLAFLVNSVKTNEERQNILSVLVQSLNLILQNQVQQNATQINEESKKKDAIIPWTSNLDDLKNNKSDKM